MFWGTKEKSTNRFYRIICINCRSPREWPSCHCFILEAGILVGACSLRLSHLEWIISQVLLKATLPKFILTCVSSYITRPPHFASIANNRCYPPVRDNHSRAKSGRAALVGCRAGGIICQGFPLNLDFPLLLRFSGNPQHSNEVPIWELPLLCQQGCRECLCVWENEVGLLHLVLEVTWYNLAYRWADACLCLRKSSFNRFPRLFFTCCDCD